MPLKRLACLLFLFPLVPAQSQSLEEEVADALGRAISFFHSINSHGGYVYYVTPDLQRRWGESPADPNTIEVQPPGTPAVGTAFLRAYRATRNPAALAAAKDAAQALIQGQNRLGGWEHTIRFDREPGKTVSFDDDQTQSAISFLMNLDQEVDDPRLDQAIEKALSMMIESQLNHGGWPHKFPKQGNYHDFATFNDEGINDCIRVMIEADRYYSNDDIRNSLKMAGLFLMRSQLPPPQPGWAQQYNEYMQPAWARSFEPPSVCPSVTINNIQTLLDLHLHLGDSRYLEPIPDALRWLAEIRLANGLWARFVEIGTGKALYYDRGRIRVDSVQELSLERRTGYGYEVDLARRLNTAKTRFEAIRSLGREAFLERHRSRANDSPNAANWEANIRTVIDQMDDRGRWITKADRFKKRTPGQLWDGEYEVADRISSADFIKNVNTLCDYLER